MFWKTLRIVIKYTNERYFSVPDYTRLSLQPKSRNYFDLSFSAKHIKYYSYCKKNQSPSERHIMVLLPWPRLITLDLWMCMQSLIFSRRFSWSNDVSGIIEYILHDVGWIAKYPLDFFLNRTFSQDYHFLQKKYFSITTGN